MIDFEAVNAANVRQQSLQAESQEQLARHQIDIDLGSDAVERRCAALIGRKASWQPPALNGAINDAVTMMRLLAHKVVTLETDLAAATKERDTLLSRVIEDDDGESLK